LVFDYQRSKEDKNKLIYSDQFNSVPEQVGQRLRMEKKSKKMKVKEEKEKRK